MAKTALIIIDIQYDYFEGGKNPLEGSYRACLKAKELLNFFRQKYWYVVHVRHVAAKAGATMLLGETRGSEIHHELKPLATEKIITKHFPNSIKQTDLLDYLRELGTERIVVCGMMTHMCVDSTVRTAKEHGFDCTVIYDACATKKLQINDSILDAKTVHDSFMAAMKSYFAHIRTVDEFISEHSS